MSTMTPEQAEAYRASHLEYLDATEEQWVEDVAAFRNEWPGVCVVPYDRVLDLEMIETSTIAELAKMAGCPIARISLDVVELAEWLDENFPNAEWTVLVHPFPFEDGLIGFRDEDAAFWFKMRWL